jgi:hypothetical protein
MLLFLIFNVFFFYKTRRQEGGTGSAWGRGYSSGRGEVEGKGVGG